MIDDNYSQATAEELAQSKYVARRNRGLRLTKDRVKVEGAGELKPKPVVRTFEADNSEIQGIDLRRVTKLKQVESDD